LTHLIVNTIDQLDIAHGENTNETTSSKYPYRIYRWHVDQRIRIHQKSSTVQQYMGGTFSIAWDDLPLCATKRICLGYMGLCIRRIALRHLQKIHIDRNNLAWMGGGLPYDVACCIESKRASIIHSYLCCPA